MIRNRLWLPDALIDPSCALVGLRDENENGWISSSSKCTALTGMAEQGEMGERTLRRSRVWKKPSMPCSSAKEAEEGSEEDMAVRCTGEL